MMYCFSFVSWLFAKDLSVTLIFMRTHVLQDCASVISSPAHHDMFPGLCLEVRLVFPHPDQRAGHSLRRSGACCPYFDYWMIAILDMYTITWLPLMLGLSAEHLYAHVLKYATLLFETL